MKHTTSGKSHVLDLRKAVVGGEHLQAANEPKPSHSEEELIAADLAREENKAQRLALRGDAIALDLQLNQQAFAAVQRFADGLPPLAED